MKNEAFVNYIETNYKEGAKIYEEGNNDLVTIESVTIKGYLGFATIHYKKADGFGASFVIKAEELDLTPKTPKREKIAISEGEGKIIVKKKEGYLVLLQKDSFENSTISFVVLNDQLEQLVAGLSNKESGKIGAGEDILIVKVYSDNSAKLTQKDVFEDDKTISFYIDADQIEEVIKALVEFGAPAPATEEKPEEEAKAVKTTSSFSSLPEGAVITGLTFPKTSSKYAPKAFVKAEALTGGATICFYTEEGAKYFGGFDEEGVLYFEYKTKKQTRLFSSEVYTITFEAPEGLSAEELNRRRAAEAVLDNFCNEMNSKFKAQQKATAEAETIEEATKTGVYFTTQSFWDLPKDAIILNISFPSHNIKGAPAEFVGVKKSRSLLWGLTEGGAEHLIEFKGPYFLFAYERGGGTSTHKTEGYTITYTKGPILSPIKEEEKPEAEKALANPLDFEAEGLSLREVLKDRSKLFLIIRALYELEDETLSAYENANSYSNAQAHKQRAGLIAQLGRFFSSLKDVAPQPKARPASSGYCVIFYDRSGVYISGAQNGAVLPLSVSKFPSNASSFGFYTVYESKAEAAAKIAVFTSKEEAEEFAAFTHYKNVNVKGLVVSKEGLLDRLLWACGDKKSEEQIREEREAELGRAYGARIEEEARKQAEEDAKINAEIEAKVKAEEEARNAKRRFVLILKDKTRREEADEVEVGITKYLSRSFWPLKDLRQNIKFSEAEGTLEAGGVFVRLYTEEEAQKAKARFCKHYINEDQIEIISPAEFGANYLDLDLCEACGEEQSENQTAYSCGACGFHFEID